MLRNAMPDTPDTPDAPKKSKKIKLGLFIPWDEEGRLFHEEKFIKPDAPAADDSKIIPFPDPPTEKSEDTPE
jgi:hypothetical protein